MTEQLLWEVAAGITALASSGASLTTTPRTAGGKLHNNMTPLERRFAGGVAHAASGLDPKVANEIVKAIMPHYVADVKDPNPGAPFDIGYDVKTRQPVKEWEEMYRRVRKEVTDLGVPIDEYEMVHLRGIRHPSDRVGRFRIECAGSRACEACNPPEAHARRRMSARQHCREVP